MKSKNTIFIVAAVIAGFVLNVLLLFFVIIPAFSQGENLTGSIGDNAAILNIEGVIMSGDSREYSHSWVMNTLDKIINDKNNHALLLKINSPGGSIYECDDIYLKLLEYKDTGRPIYTAMEQIAASGGYYIAAASDKIYANRNTITGSIGVSSGSFIDVTGFLEKNGVRVTNIVSGRNKAMGSLLEAYTQEQLDIMQSIADEAYEQFIGVVANGRVLDIAEVTTLADGRIYTARQALSARLIDEIGTPEDALNDMLEDLGMYNISRKEYRYAPKPSFLDIILNMKSRMGEQSELIFELNSARIRLPRYIAEIET